MSDFKFTAYFENEVLRKRPYVTRELCIRVIENPIRAEVQPDDRVRFWAIIGELDGRALCVMTRADRRTIHDASVDRGFKP